MLFIHLDTRSTREGAGTPTSLPIPTNRWYCRVWWLNHTHRSVRLASGATKRTRIRQSVNGLL